MNEIGTAALKALLQARVESLARELAPKGKKCGKYWMAENPTRVDHHAGSFWIALRGVPGSWRDEATGDKGDIFGLISYVRGGDFRDACEFARSWLGLSDATPQKIAREVAQARRDEDERRKNEAEDLKKKRGIAQARWLAASSDILGTVADTYLLSRGIDLRCFARMPRSLRFAPEAWHRESGRTWPALLSAMVGDSFMAVHTTFLAPDGSGKAPIDPKRKIWPLFAGSAIHIWRGETGLPVHQAAKQGLWDRLVIVEGVEDGLSIALACPEFRVWAAGSLGNIGNIRLPRCCGEVIVCADNDWQKPAAMAEFERVLGRLKAQERPVHVARSPIGKDFNDVLQAKRGNA